MRFLPVASLLLLSVSIKLGPVLVIPTFIPGCEQFPPRVTSRYLLSGKPVAHDRFAGVDVFLRGQRPPRPFFVIGDVEVISRSRNTSLGNMVDYASGAARKMGGDAIVDVWPRSAEAPGGGRDPRGRHMLTAKIVRWSLAPG